MYHIQARKKRLLLICGGIQTDPVVCWQKWKGACDNMRMAALLMAMIALLGLVLGSVRAVFPVRGRAAFLPDMH